MPNSKTTGTNDGSCCNCGSSVGDSVKVQPTRVVDADGKGPGEVWCPRCFVWKRMLLEPERFNASHVVAARCQFCHYLMVSPGGDGRGVHCSNCGRGGAMMLRPSPEELEQIAKAVRSAAEEHNDTQ